MPGLPFRNRRAVHSNKITDISLPVDVKTVQEVNSPSSLCSPPVAQRLLIQSISKMPSFYPRQHIGLPLTPPEFQHYNGGMQMNHHQYAMGAGAVGTGFRSLKGAFDFQDSFHQGATFGPVSHHQAQPQQHQYHHHRNSQTFSGLPPPGLALQNHNQSKFYHVESSVVSLPPVKHLSSDQMFDDAMHVNGNTGMSSGNCGSHGSVHHQVVVDDRKSAPAKTEEKPVGGVSAVLDYEMSDMADFVASMASGMYDRPNRNEFSLFSTDIVGNRMSGQSQTVPSQTFRKFVFQILSSTRLPSSTILLGLDYLHARMNMRGGQYAKHNQIYKTFTVALLLASKFLDDNTFQNRSWADVTGIPVPELNALEAEWLESIGWRLHYQSPDMKGFAAWKNAWESFANSKKAVKPIPPTLAPIDTKPVNRLININTPFSPVQQIFPQQQQQQQQVQLPHLHSQMQLPTPISQTSAHGQPESVWWPVMVSAGDHSPPSAPETGPATPEWNVGMNWATHMHNQRHHQDQYQMRPMSQVSNNLQAYSLGVQNHHNWNGHCGCSGCVNHSAYPFGQNNFMFNYGQTVVA